MRSNPPSTIDRPKSVWMIVGLCVLGLCHAPLEATAAYTLSRGRQILLNRGLQVQAEVDVTCFGNVSAWTASNFTGVNFYTQRATNPPNDVSVLAMMPTGTCWGCGWSQYLSSAAASLSTAESASYGNGFVGMQYYDEADITDSGILDDMKAKFANFKAAYSNALAYTNFYPGQAPSSAADLESFTQYTQPDMVMFDYYPSFAFGEDSRNTWYAAMQQYRTGGLAGYTLSGGGNSGPLPYAQYLSLTRGVGSTYSDPMPSESFVRLQQNASWAFGYTFAEAYLYNPSAAWQTAAAMFNGPDDSSPSAAFDYVKETNRESRNLGPALVRLVSTDIQIIRGSSYTSLPSGISRWGKSNSGSSLKWQNSKTANTGGYTDYITTITPYTNSTANGGTTDSSYGDVLVGYFNPLLSNNAGYTFADGLHFMIVNGDTSGTAAAAAQWYHLTFDFSGSSFNELVRLSRDTGKVEPVALTSTGGSTYYLDLNLPGGTGDLFGFWNSNNPLPTPEPGALIMLAVALLGALAYAWRKRNRGTLIVANLR